jgi:CubicO group peptidase (beta-lactamase class C family)
VGTNAQPAQLKGHLQKLIDDLSEQSGYAIQLGFKNADQDFSVAGGSISGKKVTESDTFLFGSGTKPFTASAVMQLVEAGTVSLDDKLSIHIDPVLQKMNGTTFEKLFGPKATTVTVGMLISMQAGVPDYDVPSFDDALLNDATREHPPMECLTFAATLPWVCDPGSCVSYSSTNFVLAGLILVNHAAKTWQTYDMRAVIPSSLKPTMPVTQFFTTQKISEYLTVPGESGYGKTTAIFNQSSTILWWTCGNMVTQTREVARFFWALLGPTPTIVNATTLAAMEHFKPLNKGWASGTIQYGTGLMIQAVSPKASLPPQIGEDGTYVGHGGDTCEYIVRLNRTIFMSVASDCLLSLSLCPPPLCARWVPL